MNLVDQHAATQCFSDNEDSLIGRHAQAFFNLHFAQQICAFTAQSVTPISSERNAFMSAPSNERSMLITSPGRFHLRRDAAVSWWRIYRTASADFDYAVVERRLEAG
jgi:hypothetical protein